MPREKRMAQATKNYIETQMANRRANANGLHQFTDSQLQSLLRSAFEAGFEAADAKPSA